MNLMAADNAHVRDPLDTVHHEMYSVVHSHYVHKSVPWPVIVEQLILEKEPADQSTNKFAVAVMKDSQIVGCTPSENLFTDHMVFYYTKGLCCPLASVCHITGRRRKGKGLEVPCKYNY